MQEAQEKRFNPWIRKIPWRWAWQPTPVFLARKFHGQRSLVGRGVWWAIVYGDSEESTMTERTLTYHLSKPFLMAHCVKKKHFFSRRLLRDCCGITYNLRFDLFG